MALSVVDAHVRERLMWLRQQQEDMTILLSQVSTACLHCEKTLQQVRDELGSGLIYPCQADTDSCSLFPVVGRLQSRAGEAGDQLSAGDAPEAAAPVHGAGRPHPAGRRHPRHLHEGTRRSTPCSQLFFNPVAKAKRAHCLFVFHAFRTTGSTSVQRWRSGS